jgi:mannose-6-phosphate isomerase-like protein (cupin superfamily)
MSERHAAGPSGPQTPPPTPAFPGATAITVLDVYDWPAPDGLRGGSAHVHLASTEGYLVLDGTGQLQTLSQRGYAETPLRPGDCLWFTPGTIHRLVNDGGLRILVVMQNAGLPEDGDAVLTFPPDVLADPDAYRRAASLGAAPGAASPAAAPGTGTAVPPDVAARRRRDLAITGYLALRDQGPDALRAFHAAAVKLVAARAGAWRDRWRAGALVTAEQTGAHLAGIAAGAPAHLAAAGLWRIDRSAGEPSYGMCGRLTTYPSAQAVRAG